jgi:hypothetical protein
MKKTISPQKTVRGDKNRIRMMIGALGDELLNLRMDLQSLGNLPTDQTDREMYLIKQNEMFMNTISAIISAHHYLDELCSPKQAGGKPKNKHWNDAFFLLHDQFQSTGKLLSAKKLSVAITQKFYLSQNQHPDLNGNDPLPERIASEIIRAYKEVFNAELKKK